MHGKTVSKAERKKTLEEYILKKRFKFTKQRYVIFDEFLNYPGCHMTSEELYEKVKKQNPRVGYSTVYRTLKLFKECGLAFERNFEDGRARYEPVKFDGEHHDHLICIGCGRIIEFVNPRIERYRRKVARLNDFEIVNCKLEIYGYCTYCTREKKGLDRKIYQ